MSSNPQRLARPPALLERVDTLDEVLHAHAAVLGADLVPYGITRTVF